jgi:sugar phosphate isomerase/epimerase
LVGTFVDYGKLRDDIDGAIKDAKALGVEYVLCGWIPHEGTTFTEHDAREAAEVFNRAGEKLNAAGFHFVYHPHGYEFRSYKNGTLFDLLAAETRPEFVSFELDVFWVEHSGADPVKLLRKYRKRFELLHIKDLRKGAHGDLTGTAPDADSVAVGSGTVDWPAILKAAQRGGVRYYFIEDESDGAMNQIPQSLRYLKSIFP